MDKSLDDIVMQNARPKGQRRGSARRSLTGRAQILGNAAAPTTAPATRARAAAANVPPAAAAPFAKGAGAEKIMVSNLPQDVNEAQIKELFDQTIGPCVEVNLNHDAQGRSKGVAYVRFRHRGHGRKAYEQYHNRMIDGKRAMRIEVIVDPTAIGSVAPSLASRVGPSNGPIQQAAAPVSNGRGRGTAPRGAGGRGGRGGRGRGGGAPHANRPKKTVEDLDAEMEDYTSANAAPAAPAAAAAAPAPVTA